MTKVSVFGQPTEQKELKPIEILFYLHDNKRVKPSFGVKAKDWENIMLLTKNHNAIGLDLILGYDNYMVKDGIINDAVLYLGHWNDGVV